MANLGGTIKRSELPVDEGGGSFDPLPAGWYDVKITGAELKDTKSGTGQYIKVEYSITGDKFGGRKVWGMLNIRNDSQKAEEIGRQQLSSLMGATGMEELEDSDQLIGADLSIKLKIKPAQGEYAAGNDVAAFKALEGGAKPQGEAKTEGSKPPWSK